MPEQGQPGCRQDGLRSGARPVARGRLRTGFRRRLPWALAVALGVPVAAAAANLGVAAAKLGAGASAVAACDTAFTETYATVSGNVTSVTVGDIADPTCEGAELTLRLTDSTGASIASAGPAAVGTDPDTSPNSVTVSVDGQPDADAVAGIRISLTGP